jgi:hypothetical protein
MVVETGEAKRRRVVAEEHERAAEWKDCRRALGIERRIGIPVAG